MAKRFTKRADGRYVTTVTDTRSRRPDGKPNKFTIYAKSQRELEQKVSSLRYQIDHNLLESKSDVTVGEYADLWVETYKSVRQRKTKRMYLDCIRFHIRPEIGDIMMRSLRNEDVQGMINDNKDHYRTCEIIRLTMRQLTEQAKLDGILLPSFNLKLTLPPKSKCEKRALTLIEKKALRTANFEAKDQAFVYMIYGCGLRRGEVLALSKDSFDFVMCTVHVENVIEFDENRSYWKEIPKNEGSIRDVPIPDSILSFIQWYVEMHTTTVIVDNGPVELLFSTNGGIVTPSSYRRTWERILRAMNASVRTVALPNPIEGLTAHIFRHNYATMLYYSGISIKKAADLMGHSDVKMIMDVYAHLDEEKENAAAKINETIKL